MLDTKNETIRVVKRWSEMVIFHDFTFQNKDFLD
jgi:hypothetical protein